MLPTKLLKSDIKLRIKHVFYLGPDAAFDESGIETRIGYCTIRQYNKDNPERICVDFFI